MPFPHLVDMKNICWKYFLRDPFSLKTYREKIYEQQYHSLGCSSFYKQANVRLCDNKTFWNTFSFYFQFKVVLLSKSAMEHGTPGTPDSNKPARFISEKAQCWLHHWLKIWKNIKSSFLCNFDYSQKIQFKILTEIIQLFWDNPLLSLSKY